MLTVGLELVTAHTSPANFERVFLEVVESLRLRGCQGIIFGNIHLADVRAWYEERVRGAGVKA